MVVKFRYGKFGSGKTSGTVLDLIIDLVNENRRPISNMEKLNLPNSVYVTPMDIISSIKPATKAEEELLEKTISQLKNKEKAVNDIKMNMLLNDLTPKSLFLDEIGKWWDSRNHSSQLNRFLGYFVDQIRKRNMNLYVTDQHVSGYDLRGRQVTDKLIRCVGQYYPKELIQDELGRPIPYRFHYWDMDVEWESVKYYWIDAELMSNIYDFYSSTEKIVPAEMLIAQ